MVAVAVRWSLHFEGARELLINWDWVKEPKAPPSAKELATVPSRFRCYACWEVKGKKRHFGGLIAGQRICRGCFPYLDERDVKAIMWFDLRHGYPVP